MYGDLWKGQRGDEVEFLRSKDHTDVLASMC